MKRHLLFDTFFKCDSLLLSNAAAVNKTKAHIYIKRLVILFFTLLVTMTRQIFFNYEVLTLLKQTGKPF